MYNNYLEDIVSINSEFIYESILIESNMFTGMIQKIKSMWEKFLNFVRNIKNKILTLIKGGKKEIIESDKQIKAIDYKDHIEKLRALSKMLENDDLSFENIDKFVNSFRFDVDYNKAHNDISADTILGKKSVKDVVKTLELRITEAEKILERIKKLLDDKILSRAERELVQAEKDNDQSKINEIKGKINKVTGASNKIISTITNFIDQIRKDIEYCYKEAKGEFTLPELVTKSDIREIEKSVDDARHEIINALFNYYSSPMDKQIKKQKFIISHAEKIHGDKLYESDKRFENEADFLNKINLEYVKKNDITDKEFHSAKNRLKGALNDNFSKRRVSDLIGKVLITEEYLFKKNKNK